MPDENDIPKRATRPPYISLKRGTRPARIYLADDEDGVRAALTLMFQFWYGDYILSEFPDGDKVWDAINCNTPDLIITDITHPGMKVEEMLHRLYRTPKRFPVIVCSATLGCPGFRERHSAFTMFPVLTLDKPFTGPEFRRVIRLSLDLPPRYPYFRRT